MELRICHIGAGRMGSIRQQNFQSVDGIRCVAIVDPNVNPSTFPSIPVFASFDQVNVDYDMVWISTPTNNHKQAIAKASEKTKIIFCEKPIASSFAEVKECYDICERKNVCLFCGWMRRFDEHYRRLFRHKHATNPSFIAGHFVSLDYPLVSSEFLRTLGSIFVDLMCHDFHLVANFFDNEMPISITAIKKDTDGDGVPDSANCVLEFRGNRFVFFEASRHSTAQHKHMCSAKLHTNNNPIPIIECGNDIHSESFSIRFAEAFVREVRWLLKLWKRTQTRQNDEKKKRKYTFSELFELTQTMRRSCELTALLVELADISAHYKIRIHIPNNTSLDEKSFRSTEQIITQGNLLTAKL